MNNKVSLIISIIALLGVILLTINSVKKSGDTQESVKKNIVTDTASLTKSSNIAYINIDSLVDSYTLYNELKTALLSKQERLSHEQENKMMSLQRKEMEIQQQLESRMMTQTKAQEEAAKLYGLQQQYLQENQQLEVQLAEENQKMTLRVYDSIQSYLKEFNKDLQYELILSSTVLGGTVMLAKDGMDITTPVLKGMNERYSKSTLVSENKK